MEQLSLEIGFSLVVLVEVILAGKFMGTRFEGMECVQKGESVLGFIVLAAAALGIYVSPVASFFGREGCAGRREANQFFA